MLDSSRKASPRGVQGVQRMHAEKRCALHFTIVSVIGLLILVAHRAQRESCPPLRHPPPFPHSPHCRL